MRPRLVITAALLAASAADAGDAPTGVASLDELSIEALRADSFGGPVRLAAEIDCPGRAAGATAPVVGYVSDGLDVYAQVAVPGSPAPEGGHPVVLFLHGWVGVDGAPEYGFACDEDAYYADIVNGHVERGHVVAMPGFRGHGTMDGVPADGIEWMADWDNGSYLSPVFYARDVLNLPASFGDIEALGLTGAGDAPLALDLGRVHVLGHSQGGDVAAMVLAAVGEGAANGLSVHSGSLWSATFPDRFTQLMTYRPMESTRAAFVSGDGTWNGTATGADGSVNPDFVFGYPPSWIGTMDEAEWTWQAETFNRHATVREAIEFKLDEMYGALERGVADLSGIEWSTGVDADGRVTVTHDPRVVAAHAGIGATAAPHYLTEPMALHVSDRDVYSMVPWNEALCAAANGAGGRCAVHVYPGTDHVLGVAAAEWFSPAGTRPGLPGMIDRDASLIADG